MLNKVLFKDSSGKKSLTATVFVWGAFVVNLKLIFSGITIASLTFAPLAGSSMRRR